MGFQRALPSAALSQATLYACLLASASISPVAAESTLCTDVSHLLEQSKSGFYAIQSDKKSMHGGFNTTKALESAQYCVIFEDPKKRSYKCTWAYAFGEVAAHNLYEQVASVISECLGSRANRQVDQPVNHPDTYKAYLYTLADTELRVTFKDKSELKSTLVSVIIEGKHLPH